MDVLYLDVEGSGYEFRVFPIGTVFNSVSGVYVLLSINPSPKEREIDSSSPTPPKEGLSLVGEDFSFVGMTADSSLGFGSAQPPLGEAGYEILYIGIASSFRHRFYNHPTFLLAVERGMSHIGILKVSSGRKRRKIEKVLVGALEPPLNRYLI